MTDDAFAKIIYEVDPIKDKIEDQHIKFASYLKDRYLNVDIYDAVRGFYYGTCRIPLFEMLRQKRESTGDRPKECEIFNPNTSKYCGYLDLIMRNDGARTSELMEDIPKKPSKDARG